jgi:hypothetical protein
LTRAQLAKVSLEEVPNSPSRCDVAPVSSDQKRQAEKAYADPSNKERWLLSWLCQSMLAILDENRNDS